VDEISAKECHQYLYNSKKRKQNRTKAQLDKETPSENNFQEISTNAVGIFTVYGP